MDDHKLDELLNDARDSYRVPPPPAVEAIWQRVEAETFVVTPADERRWQGASWRAAGMLAAASLVIGVFAGRWSAGVAESPPAAAPVTTAVVAAPYQRATEEVLGGAAVVLAALRSSETSGDAAVQVAAQAARLLSTTRLLVDSPAAADPRMRNLLLDLEITLAQIARLKPARVDADLNLINNAIAERDMMPRIRSAVVDLSGGAY